MDLAQMTDFDTAFVDVVGIEGNYSTDQSDPGNWTGGHVGLGVFKGTKFGLSAAQFPDLDIPNVTVDQAKPIYLARYWQPLKCDELPAPLNRAVFEFGVNEGQPTAALMLQKALGVAQDGDLGPVTIAAAKSLALRYSVSMFIAQCALHYVGLKGFGLDGLGWMRRCALTAMDCKC